jgi:hypothetical protein
MILRSRGWSSIHEKGISIAFGRKDSNDGMDDHSPLGPCLDYGTWNGTFRRHLLEASIFFDH